MAISRDARLTSRHRRLAPPTPGWSDSDGTPWVHVDADRAGHAGVVYDKSRREPIPHVRQSASEPHAESANCCRCSLTMRLGTLSGDWLPGPHPRPGRCASLSLPAFRTGKRGRSDERHRWLSLRLRPLPNQCPAQWWPKLSLLALQKGIQRCWLRLLGSHAWLILVAERRGESGPL